MLDRSTQAGAHALKVRKDDLYETPPEAVHALLRHEVLPSGIWEPACGPGSIVTVLRARGHMVCATDLVDYGQNGEHGIDFLMERVIPFGVQAIVTNPPFKLANEFVRHALELCPRVVMLLRLSFLESNHSRNDLLDGGQLARVWVFRNRLPMMHRAGWAGARSSSATPFAWFSWDRANRGRPTELHRITWEPAP